MGATITTEANINASPKRVWAVLTDFAAYPEWNPFIRSIAGSLIEGSRLVVRLEPPDGRGITMRPTVLSVVPQQELRWLGHLFVPRLFDGEHQFYMREVSEGWVRFSQQELFMGALVPLTKKLLRKTERGFEQMNQALKERAESR